MHPTPENPEYITPHLARYYLDQGRIVVFKTTNTSRKNVDAWARITEETARSWSENQPYLELHDMREALINSYAQYRANELTTLLSDIPGRAAVLIAKNTVGDIMTRILNLVFNRGQHGRLRRVFTDYDEAVAWLRGGYQ